MFILDLKKAKKCIIKYPQFYVNICFVLKLWLTL